MKKVLLGLAIGTLLLQAADTYTDAIHAWQQHRDEGLRSPEGWLTLAGLFWLTPDKDEVIGTAENADFPLPKGSAPTHLGRLHLHAGQVTFTNLGGPAVTVDGKPVSGTVALSASDENPSVVRAGSVSFFTIQRGDRFGIRARDSNSALLKNFKGMRYFPVSAAFDFRTAKFVKDQKKIPILNVIGQTDLEDSPGYVEFAYQGKTYHVRPIFEGDSLFFLFKDPTNRTQTYQAGRMLNTPLPKDGTVDLDFNRSYNPPCTFTPYATCPLPPKENDLTIPIVAGEMRFGHGRAGK